MPPCARLNKLVTKQLRRPDALRTARDLGQILGQRITQVEAAYSGLTPQTSILCPAHSQSPSRDRTCGNMTAGANAGGHRKHGYSVNTMTGTARPSRLEYRMMSSIGRAPYRNTIRTEFSFRNYKGRWRYADQHGMRGCMIGRDIPAAGRGSEWADRPTPALQSRRSCVQCDGLTMLQRNILTHGRVRYARSEPSMLQT